MKTLAALFVAGLACWLPATGQETAKPLISLSVKKQVVDSDHDQRGRQGSSKEQTLVLKVEVTNVSGATIQDAQLSGDALVSRAQDLNEKIVKETLGTLQLPAMKPNERLTLELGKLRLTELELRGRKFEETLEEWKVVCTRGQAEIGKTVSSDRYESLAKQVQKPASRPFAPAPSRRKQQ